MLEILGLTTAQEVLALTSVGVVDLVLPELILAEAMVITGVLIYRAIRKHKREKEEQENKPSDADQDVQQPDDEAEEQKVEEEKAEEQKQIDDEIDDEIVIEEAKNVEELLNERDERLDDMRNDGPDDEPDDNNNGGGGGPPDGDDNNNEQINNDDQRRENPYFDLIMESAKYLAEQYDNQKKKEAEQQKQYEDKKINDEQYEQMQTENQQIRNQLEVQKQMLDILDAMGINEITDEQALVQLEKIEQDLKNIQKKDVKVGDIFAQDIVTF